MHGTMNIRLSGRYLPQNFINVFSNPIFSDTQYTGTARRLE